MQAVAFGECMIELARDGQGTRIGFAGDTANTATYLARLGVRTAYMTAVGADAWSADMKANWAGEGIALSMVLTHPTRAPGLYAISVNATGERSFTYWRDQSAARAFFQCPGVDEALRRAASTGLFYLTGISLAILSPSERRRIVALACEARAAGKQVVFDPNYRPRLWPSVEGFKASVLELAPALTMALPSFDDEANGWGDASPEATLARWQGLGVGEVVVKHGALGALTVDGWAPARTVHDVLDTTGAGDSFNAGYLARRLAGDGPLAAAGFAARLAAEVVRHPGAIIPKSAMPALEPVV